LDKSNTSSTLVQNYLLVPRSKVEIPLRDCSIYHAYLYAHSYAF